MNIKLIAALSALGVICTPVYAINNGVTTHTVVKHTHHPVTKSQPLVEPNYKDEVQPAPVDVCTISQTKLVMDMMSQNAGRSLPNPCNPGWFNRIHVSGGVNIDAGKWGDRNANFMGVNYQTLSINDAYLNVSALINDWTQAFASISYNTATIANPIVAFFNPGYLQSEYSAAYSNNAVEGFQHNIQLEQAYFTVANFDEYPLFLQVGKQFQDFGRYEIHPITRSMTQVMSETLATSAKLGFISPLGVNGSVAVFNNPTKKIGTSENAADYTVSLGFAQSVCDFAWDIGAAYIYDLNGVNDVAFSVGQFNLFGSGLPGYTRRAGGVATYADVSSGPFSVNFRWTGATQTFNPNDLPEHGVYGLSPSGTPLAGEPGAKPWSLGLQAGYAFEGYRGMNQNIYAGYQTSREAAGLSLPKNRWLVGAGVEPWKNTTFTVEWDHDKDYSVSDGGTSDSYNLVSLRAAVKFG